MRDRFLILPQDTHKRAGFLLPPLLPPLLLPLLPLLCPLLCPPYLPPRLLLALPFLLPLLLPLAGGAHMTNWVSLIWWQIFQSVL